MEHINTVDAFVSFINSLLANPDYEEGKDIESFSFKDEPRKQFVVNTYWGTWDINKTGIAVPIATIVKPITASEIP